MNSQKQTHSMALMVIQSGENSSEDMQDDDEIPRVKKVDMKKVEFEDVPKIEYQGPKQPSMSHKDSVQNVQSLKLLASAALSLKIGKEIDFEFFKAIATTPSTPEFSGFNNRRFRDAGVSLQPKTSAVYTPLIDEIPSDPSTVLTTLTEAIRLTEETDQEYTILTFDQQLYKLLVFIKWSYPIRFQKVIARLGGMHLLMSFIGCVGNLMANSGLEDIMKAAFAGVDKMLMGSKYFPQNFRALRMVVEELLRPYLDSITTSEEMESFLDRVAAESKTAKLWVQNLIKRFQSRVYIKL